MRLHRIKLAGFKSFVDPTTITLPSNLIGIVGPNGCGKSNTIDAVRWVMGESSAKHLRGESMEDVIFSGSNSRKPVGKASIELIFDNSAGKLGGEYARYNEIAIRREVTRDGQSNYYLNGARCRRRDITDIFLGTGLGPRSYSIIEQGMISRLIEAKPQDLRVFFEEAAGISKYKERRRETETRIRHTRENLDRLNDLREEIDKQLRHLERQSRSAQKYKEYKEEERKFKAELVELRLRKLDAELAAKQQLASERETGLEAITAELRSCENKLTSAREQRVETNEAFQEAQAQFYRVGGEISALEQTISHQRETLERRQQEQNETRQTLVAAAAELARDEATLLELTGMLEQLEPELEDGQEGMMLAREQLATAEESMQDWRDRWDDFNRQAAEPAQKAQVERARMEQLERSISRLEERRSRLIQEQQMLDVTPHQGQLESLSEELLQFEQVQDDAEAELVQVHESIDRTREALQSGRNQLSELQQQQQQARGRLASLEALQQAALGKDKQKLSRWLDAQQLAQAARLAEQISAREPWGRAVEIVLGDFLEAVEVDDLATYPDALRQVDQGQVILFEAVSTLERGAEATLWDQVVAPASVQDYLGSIRIAETVEQALAQRYSLAPHESIITPEGFWVGRGWMRFSTASDEHGGVLERKAEIEQLKAQLDALDDQVAVLQDQVEQARARQTALEQRRNEQQNVVNQSHRSLSETRAKIEQHKSRLEQVRQRLESLGGEVEDLAMQLETEQESLTAAVQARNAAVSQTEDLARERERFEQEREVFQAQVQQHRQRLEELRNSVHEKQIKTESLRSRQQSTEANLLRMRTQSAALDEKLSLLMSELEDSDQPIEDMREQLEILLEQRLERETALSTVRDRLNSIENDSRELELKRHEFENRINAARGGLEEARIASRELMVRVQTQIDQLREMEVTREAISIGLGGDASIPLWEAELQRLEGRIQRLGPINLAAIDEFKEQSERKEHLDQQFADLTEALETLENAIAKIDRETRSRFRETFDTVNNTFQTMFPKLFGGGQAKLELTEDDLLTTGVLVMARPPGKRITNIHLMSGGEKALTAVALVFAIFELNPAPFCMLDEVDAPLDDANVGRFCELVREMSERVQFIFITHNKVTMELAQQLVGVTMRESGVSRLVDVNVDEAALMANG